MHMLHLLLEISVLPFLRVFQRVTGLPVNGVIDKATLEMMRQPRCGIEDTFNQKTLKYRLLGECGGMNQCFPDGGLGHKT